MLPSALPLIPLGRPALKLYTRNDFCLLPWVSSDCKSVPLRSSLSRVPAKEAFTKEGVTLQYSLLCCELVWTWEAVVSMTTLGLEKRCFNSISWVLWKRGLCLIRGDPSLTLLWNKRKNQNNKTDKVCCLPSPSHTACYEWTILTPGKSLWTGQSSTDVLLKWHAHTRLPLSQSLSLRELSGELGLNEITQGPSGPPLAKSSFTSLTSSLWRGVVGCSITASRAMGDGVFHVWYKNAYIVNFLQMLSRWSGVGGE